MIDIILVDDNKQITEILTEHFATLKDLNLIAAANDGEEALEIIKRNEFDVLVLDALMPKLDGLELLKQINTKETYIIMSTIVTNENMVKQYLKYDINHYMCKPYSNSALIERIRDCKKEEDLEYKIELKEKNRIQKNDNNKTKIKKLLKDLGVPSHIKGYKYLVTGIKKSLTNEKILKKVTGENGLYAVVKEKHNDSFNSVENAMRYAIKKTWENGNKELLDKIFGHTVHSYNNIPKTSQFVNQIKEEFKEGRI